MPPKRLNDITGNSVSHFVASDKARNRMFYLRAVPVRMVTTVSIKDPKVRKEKKKERYKHSADTAAVHFMRTVF